MSVPDHKVFYLHTDQFNNNRPVSNCLYCDLHLSTTSYFCHWAQTYPRMLRIKLHPLSLIKQKVDVLYNILACISIHVSLNSIDRILKLLKYL